MLLKLVLRQIWREKQSREFVILNFALGLSMLAITVLFCLITAFNQSLNKEARNLLGADLIAESSQPLASDFSQIAIKHHLEVSSMVEFFSMVIHQDKMQLTNVNAIQDTYPLKGHLQVKTLHSKENTFAPPPQGEIWCDEDLVQRLGIQLNETISLGNAQLIFTGIILNHPVATSDSGSILAPLAYVNQKDLSKINVLQPGSRATYRLLFSGDQAALSVFRSKVEKLSSDVQWIDAKSGRPAVNRTIADVERFIAVFLLIQVILAGIAIAMCAHQYCIRQRKEIAIWRCIGASNKLIMRSYFLILMGAAIFSLFVGVVLGYLIAYAIIHYFSILGTSSHILSVQGPLLAGWVGIIMLFGFALPPILELKDLAAVEIKQKQSTHRFGIRLISYGLAILLVCLLLYVLFLNQDQARLSLSFVWKMLGLGFLSWIFIYGGWQIFPILSKRGSLIWRLGFSYLARYQWQSITQWSVFTFVLTLLLLVLMLGYDFIGLWRSQLSQTTPNYFLINIQSHQVKSMEQWLQSHHLEANVYPVVRGRMLKVNGVRVGLKKDPNAPQGLERPINLTWMGEMPADNQIISGMTWAQVNKGQPLISVEKGFADRQHLVLGDDITFEVADREITAKVVSFRTVNWESFKPNFFVIFPPGVIDNFPHSYFTSVYIPANQKNLIFQLVSAYPEISVIDIDAILTHVREMVAKLAIMLNGLLIILFILGVLILYANLISTLKERLQESAMLKILGAKQRLVDKVLLVEFSLLGVLSGIMASIVALILAQELAQHFFAIPFVFHLKWIVIGVLMGTFLITLFGFLGTREISKVSPLWLFRRTQ